MAAGGRRWQAFSRSSRCQAPAWERKSRSSASRQSGRRRMPRRPEAELPALRYQAELGNEVAWFSAYGMHGKAAPELQFVVDGSLFVVPPFLPSGTDHGLPTSRAGATRSASVVTGNSLAETVRVSSGCLALTTSWAITTDTSTTVARVSRRGAGGDRRRGIPPPADACRYCSARELRMLARRSQNPWDQSAGGGTRAPTGSSGFSRVCGPAGRRSTVMNIFFCNFAAPQ